MTEYWEKTIQTYNNYIEYPQLTEKYLKRPPFKYIFQIFLTLNSKTCFSKNVFSEPELNPDYYESPEKKMAFLKQIIKIVYDENQKICPLKPQSVIKGTECDKTNEFLQDMYHSAVSFDTKKTSIQSNPEKPNRTSLNPPQAQEQSKTVPNPSIPNSGKKKSTIEKTSTTPEQRVLPVILKEDFNTKTTNGKENLGDKIKSDISGKMAQQILENAIKEEKIVNKTRVNSGGTSQTGIKMGKLNSLGNQPGKTAQNEFIQNESKEVNYEEIKSVLQKLTQNINPMGKLVEFVEDDLEAMNKECKKWVRAFSETEEKLQKIEDEQNEELQNCHLSLNEINEQIFDFENRILSVRSRIQKNNGKIDAMLSKVVW